MREEESGVHFNTSATERQQRTKSKCPKFFQPNFLQSFPLDFCPHPMHGFFLLLLFLLYFVPFAVACRLPVLSDELVKAHTPLTRENTPTQLTVRAYITVTMETKGKALKSRSPPLCPKHTCTPMRTCTHTDRPSNAYTNTHTYQHTLLHYFEGPTGRSLCEPQLLLWQEGCSKQL